MNVDLLSWDKHENQVQAYRIGGIKRLLSCKADDTTTEILA